MRILMLSWEYPPRVIGGIATHVDGLARAMARAGHDVVVLSFDHPKVGDDEMVEGVRVLRANADLPWLPDDYLVARTASANHHLTQLGARLGSWRPQVIHAHDWQVAWAADTLRALWSVPLVATIHATERGRHGGYVPQGTPAAINAVEWWLTFQAQQIIACSRFMVREVTDGFELSSEKVNLVPNGIDTGQWLSPAPTPQSEREQLVVAWGRIQYEKGFQVLTRAIGHLRHRLPEMRCVIAGRGSYLAELQTQIDMEGVGDIVQLAGFVPDAELKRLLQRTSCVVIPSLYEPFGIVALEGMAAGAPTIVARTGGLAEIVDGTGAGMVFEPGNHIALANCIFDILAHPEIADAMRTKAAALLAGRYTWDAISAATLGVYSKAKRG
ncbi:MAG TPA: glycosyltransferase family 4 protein [Ilumatobacteraceae bacterium]